LLFSGQFGANVKRIAITGDSAGASLAVGVTFKAMVDKNVPLPVGLVLHYPVVDLTDTPYPSVLLYMHDPAVPAPALRICRDAYVPPSTSLLHPLLSIMYAPSDLLLQLPDKLFITSGQFDPLSDQAIVFSERLTALGKKHTFKYYDNLPHGFCTLCNNVNSDGRPAVLESARWIRSIFGLSSNNPNSSSRSLLSSKNDL